MKKILLLLPIIVMFLFSDITVNASNEKIPQIPDTNIYTDAKDTKKVIQLVEKAQSYFPESLLALFEQEKVQIYYLENYYIDEYNGATYKPVIDIYYNKDKEKKTRIREPIKIYIYNDPTYNVLIHEYGHALDYIWGYKTGKQACDTGISNSKSWTMMYNNQKDRLAKFRDYGLTNKQEGFAEAFMFHFVDPSFEKEAPSLNNYVKKRIQESEKLLDK